ncbi:MAG: Rnf-Nqr domain containing protein [Planctomycetota bacterium]|jgi:electron transport complex protein RnfE
MSDGVSLEKTFFAGIWDSNPVLRLLLGMCPTLAVTAAVKPALTMGLSVVFVLLFSNIVVSLLRHQLKPHLRILMFTLTIATAVTIADLYLKAFMPEMSASLGPYIPLIIVERADRQRNRRFGDGSRIYDYSVCAGGDSRSAGDG